MSPARLSRRGSAPSPIARNTKVRESNRLAAEKPKDKKALLEKEGAAQMARTRAATRQRGPENAGQMARMSQAWRRGPKIAVQMACMSQTWPKNAVQMACARSAKRQRAPENAAQMARMRQTWRRAPKNDAQMARARAAKRQRGPKNAA